MVILFNWSYPLTLARLDKEVLKMQSTSIYSTADANYKASSLLGKVLYKSVSVVPMSALWHPIVVKGLEWEQEGDFCR